MSVGKGSFFKGWASTHPNIPTPSSPGSIKELWIGHVLDIDYNNEVGKVRVRLVGESRESLDDDIEIVAYPVDQNIIKYPLPGELVLITQGLISLVAKDRYAIVYYYLTTITSSQSITFNSDPYIGQSVSPRQAEQLYTPEYEHRFENKLKSINNYLIEKSDGVTVQEKAPLRPFEGDFILQGRFGATIRMGSTTTEKNLVGSPSPANQWSEVGGANGNPITIISANKAEGPAPVVEDVNNNNSSIYLCTSQAMPVFMPSSKLKSHLYVYNLQAVDGDIISSISDITAFVESPEEEVQHYEPDNGFTIDMSKIPDITVDADLEKILAQIPDSSLEMVVPPAGTQIKGNGGQVLNLACVGNQTLVKEAAKAFLAMKKAAEASGITVSCGSGYRVQFGPSIKGTTSTGRSLTFTSQETLRRDRSRWRNRASFGKTDEEFIMKAGSSYYSPQTAAPGLSQHGNGLAADCNTGSRVSFGGVLNPTVYVWMVKNSYKFGFVRTVRTEEWHFEFQPALAKKGPYGGISSASTPAKRNSALFYADLGLDKLT